MKKQLLFLYTELTLSTGFSQQALAKKDPLTQMATSFLWSNFEAVLSAKTKIISDKPSKVKKLLKIRLDKTRYRFQTVL